MQSHKLMRRAILRVFLLLANLISAEGRRRARGCGIGLLVFPDARDVDAVRETPLTIEIAHHFASEREKSETRAPSRFGGIAQVESGKDALRREAHRLTDAEALPSLLATSEGFGGRCVPGCRPTGRR